MARKQTLVSVGIYQDTENMLNQAVEKSGSLKASVLRTAIKLGLEQILAMHERNEAATEN